MIAPFFWSKESGESYNQHMNFLFSHYNQSNGNQGGFREWRLLTFLLFMVTAFFSVGFHHPDELYQVMEYMKVYSGKSDPSILSQLEWKHQMRPWFQPIFFHWLTTPLEWIGITSPFAKSTFLRMLSGYTGFLSFSLWGICLFSNKSEVKDRDFSFQTTLWWFIPYFAVRTSSDTWGAHLLLAGLAFLFLGYKNQKTIGWFEVISFSILAGLAFLFRYQTLIVTAPAMLWMLFQANIGLKKFFGSVIMVAFIGSFELFFNYLGYGEPVCTTWNHAYTNVVLGVSHQFGTLPFWGYFYLIIKEGLGLYGLLFIACYLHLWFRRPKSLLTFATLPYFIIFCFISHKELRFLTPLIFLAPIVLALVLEEIETKLGKFASWFKNGLYLLLFLNLILFPFTNFKPANRYLGLYKAIHENQDENQPIHVFYDDYDKSKNHLRFELHFYKKRDWSEVPISSLAELNTPKAYWQPASTRNFIT